MSRKKIVPDRSKIMEKMCTYMMLMGYNNGDRQITVAKDLNRGIWKRKSRLSRKRCNRLLYLLYAADSYTLLSYTVCLGRLVWNNHLKAKRRKFEKKFAEKVKRRIDKKKMRRGRAGTVMKTNKRKSNSGVSNTCKGYQIRGILGSRSRVAVRRRVMKDYAKAKLGSPVYRLAMAISVLSFRNLCITSEWEFWAICFVKEVCGFWRSIAFGEGLSDSLISVANEFGLYVVSRQVLERLESCYGCSSSVCYPGYR